MSRSFYSQVSHAKEILEKIEKKGKPKTIEPHLWNWMVSAKGDLKRVQDELREKYA